MVYVMLYLIVQRARNTHILSLLAVKITLSNIKLKPLNSGQVCDLMKVAEHSQSRKMAIKKQVFVITFVSLANFGEGFVKSIQI